MNIIITNRINSTTATHHPCAVKHIRWVHHQPVGHPQDSVHLFKTIWVILLLLLFLLLVLLLRVVISLNR